MTEQNISLENKILILGVGGHGSISLSKLFLDTKYHFQLYYNTGDWGGSYGLWGRLLEHNDDELNKRLHKKILPVLPFADPNKLICYFFEQSGIAIKPSLDFRSDKQDDHQTRINILVKILKFNEQQQSLFQNYFDTSWNYYIQNKNILKYNKQFCLGYLVQSFIYWQYKGMNGWNKFFHNLGILPKNIYIDFTAENRQVLVAKDLSLEKYFGEDIIDNHTNPFIPNSMVFRDKIDYKTSEPKIKFINNLDQANWIIIPNGSIANWLPIVNYNSIKSKLQFKHIIWLTNPYRNKNELINTNYHSYLLDNNIKPITLSSKTNNFNKKFHNILLQDKNGKYNTQSIVDEITKIMQNTNQIDKNLNQND
jgi:hypothetical protein